MNGLKTLLLFALCLVFPVVSQAQSKESKDNCTISLTIIPIAYVKADGTYFTNMTGDNSTEKLIPVVVGNVTIFIPTAD